MASCLSRTAERFSQLTTNHVKIVAKLLSFLRLFFAIARNSAPKWSKIPTWKWWRVCESFPIHPRRCFWISLNQQLIHFSVCVKVSENIPVWKKDPWKTLDPNRERKPRGLTPTGSVKMNENCIEILGPAKKNQKKCGTAFRASFFASNCPFLCTLFPSTFFNPRCCGPR